MNQKGNALILGILVGLLIAAGLFGVYYFGIQKAATPTTTTLATQPSSSGITSPTPASSSDEASGWQTYQNSQYGFSFKYPNTWRIVDDLSKGGTIELYSYPSSKYSGSEPIMSGDAKIEVAMLNNDHDDLLVDFATKQNEGGQQGISYSFKDGVLGSNIPALLGTSSTQGKPTELGYWVGLPDIHKVLVVSMIPNGGNNEAVEVLNSFTISPLPKKTADSLTPTAGACAGPQSGIVVTVTIGMDNVPQPRCMKVTADQKLKVVNNSNQVIQKSVGRYNLNITPGQSQEIDATFGSYLLPGVHDIVGEIWLQ